MAHRRTGKKVERRPKMFYFVDGRGRGPGRVAGSRVMEKSPGKGGPRRDTGVRIERSRENFYFVDKSGNVCETKRAKRGR